MTLTGQTIRDFEIGDRIGSGGYGEVYRATQLSVDRTVAIKVILPQYAKDPVFVADFESEAKLVAQLEHTNIVPLHHYWQDEDGAFLVMRYVPGGSLKDMIEKHGGLSLARTVRLIEQIAEALAVAHDADVVHRDLKPANVLIDQRGNAYLTDFGIAKRLTSDGNSDGSGVIKGTFAYMSPEQINGEALSPQTDIYALGLMLYEMLAGKHPFHETPVAALLFKHMEEPPPDIQDIRDDLPSGINDVIQKATAKSPDNRYATALDLSAALKMTAVGTAVSTFDVPKKKPSTTRERNRSAILRNVHRSWIEQGLEQSLHHAVQIDLSLTTDSLLVDNPWDTLLRTPTRSESVIERTIVEVFDHCNSKLLILGNPGSGKTTTLLTLARELLSRAEKDASHPIPIVLNLSSWGEAQAPIEEWIVEELNLVYRVPRNISRGWVDHDELLLLLDGLDEVNETARDACVQALNHYRREHGFVDIAVCSRIADYEQLNTQLLMNGAVIIQPLNRAQVAAYFRQLGSNFDYIGHLVETDDPFFELCQSPLMLNVIALTYRDRHSQFPSGTDVETLRQDVFDAYLSSALRRQSHGSPYSNDLIVTQLHWLAQQMQAHGQSVFQIEEMQPSWLGDHGENQFLWWYLAASVLVWSTLWVGSSIFTLLFRGLSTSEVLLHSMAGLLVGVPMGILWTRRNYARWYIPLITGGVVTFAVILRDPALLEAIDPFQVIGTGIATAGVTWLILLLLVRGGYHPTTIVPFERLRFSRARIRWLPAVLTGLVITVAILGFRTPHLHPENAGLAFAAVFMLPSLLVIYLTGLISDEVNESSRPNQGIWNSLRNGMRTWLRVGVICFLSVAIAHTFLNNIWIATAEGIYIALQTGFNLAFAFGLAPALQHLVLRGVLSRQHNLPWNYAAFLNYASRLVLLQRIGGSYIFIHRYLLEYFAALEPDSDPAEK